MVKQNLSDLEKKLEQKQRKREKKRKPAMKVAGASVKQLQKIIKDKNK